MNENNGNVGWRIASALVLIAVIAGIGFFAFRAGVAQGSPVTIQAPSGQTVPAPAPYPYYGYGMPPSGARAGGAWDITMDHGADIGRTGSRQCSKNGIRKHMANSRKRKKNRNNVTEMPIIAMGISPLPGSE